MKPTFFPTPADFREWLQHNHLAEKELLVGFYKKDTGLPSITWDESVTEALCFGWIDGVRRGIDEQSYSIRFTPRKPGSIWSTVNVNKVEKLKAEGLMAPAGLDAYARRKPEKTGIYSFEKEPEELADRYKKALSENPAASVFFNAQPPSYRRPAIHWVMSAKLEATRDRRMQTLIEDSASGRKIKPLSY